MNNKSNSIILGLILAALVYTYINIETPNNMEGGGVDCNLFKKQMDNIIKTDRVYSLVLGGTINIIIYVVIILVLIYFAFIYGVRSTKYDGIVILGQKYAYGFTLSKYGEIFLRMNGNVAREKYMYASEIAEKQKLNKISDKKSSIVTKADLDNYESFLKELRKPNLKKYVDKFCEIVKPCNDCLCPGNPDSKCKLTSEAQKVIEHKKALNMDNMFFGKIPNCCCAKKLNVSVPGCDALTETIGPNGSLVTPDAPCEDMAGNILNCNDEKYLRDINLVLKPLDIEEVNTPS